MLAAGVAAYDLAAADEEQLTNAARRYFESQPVATASMVLMTGLHLIGGLPHWCDPFALFFAAYRRLRAGGALDARWITSVLAHGGSR